MSYTLDTTNASNALYQLAGELVDLGGLARVVGTRQGGKVCELLHAHISLSRPWEREIVTPGRRVSLPAQIAETMWVLAGRNDVEWLSHYLPRAAEFSDDGETWRGGYGPRIRGWSGYGGKVHDQLRHVVSLLQREPGTRRAVIAIYDPAQDTAPGKDIPCNNWLHFILRDGRLDLHVATRSNDLWWGWSGINAFEWSALQEIVAGLVGVKIGELHFSITSLHLYEHHWKRASEVAMGEVAQSVLTTDIPLFSGSAVHNYSDLPLHPVEALDALIGRWFDIEGSIRTRTESDQLLRELVRGFPEPMMRGWLVALLWWWGVDEEIDPSGQMTPRARYALAHSPARPRARAVQPEPKRVLEGDEFAQFVSDLHAEKSAAYGDSWKRRGEQMGIMANIARKVDRLGVAGGGDTSADTAIDLLVYLIKYRRWLEESLGRPVAEEITYVGVRLYSYTTMTAAGHVESEIRGIKARFEELELLVRDDHPKGEKLSKVEYLIRGASPLARRLWADECAAVAAPDYQNPYRNITEDD